MHYLLFYLLADRLALQADNWLFLSRMDCLMQSPDTLLVLPVSLLPYEAFPELFLSHPILPLLPQASAEINYEVLNPVPKISYFPFQNCIT